MAKRASALQPGQFFLPENLRHQTHVFVHEKTGSWSIAGDNSSALLSTMLQRKQTIVRQHCGVRMTEHAEKPDKAIAMLRERDVPFQQLGKVGGEELQIRIDEQSFRWRVVQIYDEWWNAIRRAVEQDESIPSL